MKIVKTHEMYPEDLTAWEREQVYNGLDTCVTAEILEVLLPQLDNHTAATYNFERQLQGPVLEMRLRGVLIDKGRKAEVLEQYADLMDRLEAQLERICGEAFGMWNFNWRPNSRDLPELFYERMGITPIRKAGRPTCDRDALEKLEDYMIAMQVVKHVLALRDLMKKSSMLRTEVDYDGRMRTSYNIAGTSTGRLSSSFSEFGTGTNLQNIEESLRSVFVADKGMKLAYIDAEQGESRVVGAIEWNLFQDGRYLDACESGDLHTNVARLTWGDLHWTGNLEHDRALAERAYYRHHSRRDMCKKIGHGTNYGGKPRTIASVSKVDIGLIEDFQPKYFHAFPAHLRWHDHVRKTLYQQGYLVTLTGRKRWFFGRRGDDDTLREAIAYDPQGSLADILNRGMLEVWRQRTCQLLMQIHDAVLVQYPEKQEDEIIPKVLAQLRYPITLAKGREFAIPYGVATGWNWGKFDDKDNPDGLKAYTPGDKRKRSPEVHILDRQLHSVHRQSRKR
jgi:DNA polymerase I